MTTITAHETFWWRKLRHRSNKSLID